MTATAKHTEGKWFMAPDTTGNQGDFGIWTNGSPFNIATVHGSGNGEALANARLIAAAPDLLAACENAAERAAERGDKVQLAALNAAIAKARGE